MNRRWTVTLLVCLLIAGGTVAAIVWPRTLPLDKCSPLYRQFQGREGFRCAYIKDFAVNDTLQVSVTLIEATSDSVWASLMNERPQYFPTANVSTDGSAVFMTNVDKQDPAKYGGTQLGAYDLLATYLQKRILLAFDIQTEEQDLLVTRYLIRNLNGSTNKQ